MHCYNKKDIIFKAPFLLITIVQTPYHYPRKTHLIFCVNEVAGDCANVISIKRAF